MSTKVLKYILISCVFLVSIIILINNKLSIKETIYEFIPAENFQLNSQIVNAKSIKFGGVVDSLQDVNVVNNEKIETIINYLSSIKVVCTKEKTSPILSADLIVNFYDDIDAKVETIYIYRNMYIKNGSTSEIYWIKSNEDIIEKIKSLIAQLEREDKGTVLLCCNANKRYRYGNSSGQWSNYFKGI